MSDPQTYLFNSGTFQPLVNGQVLGVDVDRNAGVVTVSNQSPNLDILISLNPQAPSPTATPLGGWPYVVHQGDRIDIPVPGASQTQTPTGTFWQGKVWLLPIVNNSVLAVTGALPPIGNVWITVHQAGQIVPNYQASTLSVSPIGQQRVLTVPAMPDLMCLGNGSVSAATPLVLGGPTPNATLGSYAAQYTIYLYYYEIYCATAGNTALEITASIIDSLAVEKVTAAAAVGVVSNGANSNNSMQHESQFPQWSTLPTAPGWSTPLTLRLKIRNTAGLTPQAVWYNIGWSAVPLTNGQAPIPPPIAGGINGSYINQSGILY